jgi:hypothetical protein
MLIAKHDFKLQLKLGEYVQFHKGQKIPSEYCKADSPFFDFLRDHCDSGVIKPQMLVTPEMKRLTEMPQHVKEQEEVRAKLASHPMDIPQKKTAASQPVPKMEPKRGRK